MVESIRRELHELAAAEVKDTARAAALVGRLMSIGLKPRAVGLSLRQLGLSSRQVHGRKGRVLTGRRGRRT
jgi:hypothetical protein